jgi:hypothetical protein
MFLNIVSNYLCQNMDDYTAKIYYPNIYDYLIKNFFKKIEYSFIKSI